jgi:hypothetical protein
MSKQYEAGDRQVFSKVRPVVFDHEFGQFAMFVQLTDVEAIAARLNADDSHRLIYTWRWTDTNQVVEYASDQDISVV